MPRSAMTQTSIDIMLVEDSDSDALVLRYELGDSPFGPFSITHVHGVPETLSRLETEQFDVVLLDLGLGDTQDLATLERIQNEKAFPTPIVVLTGLEDEQLGIRALQEGAVDYLVKGGSGAHLRVRAIRYAIERRRAGDALFTSEQRLAMAVDAAELGIFDWDFKPGNITWSFHFAPIGIGI